jgi:hypothetical protein
VREIVKAIQIVFCYVVLREVDVAGKCRSGISWRVERSGVVWVVRFDVTGHFHCAHRINFSTVPGG